MHHSYHCDPQIRNSLIKLKVLLLDGVDTIKYLTYNSNAFLVSKVYKTFKQTSVMLCLDFKYSSALVNLK